MVRLSAELDVVLELLAKKKDVLTIVEGKKDVAALRAFGFTNLIELTGKPLYAVVELVEKGTIVQLLTDLDSEGKKLFSQLRADLTQRGVRIDNELRDALFATQLRQIEGLVSYIERNKLTTTQ